MIDQTLDIAREYFLALKLSDKELQELEDFTVKEEQERQKRKVEYEKLYNISKHPLNNNFPNPPDDGIADDSEEVKEFNESTVNDVPYDESDENIVGTATSIPIQSDEDHQKELDSHPEPLKRIRKMMDKKYYKDKRLKYSNEYYWGSVMSVIIHDYVERRTYSITAFDIALEIAEKYKDLTQDINLKTNRGDTPYPQEAIDEFDKRIDALNRDCTWYTHEDGCRINIIHTALHHNKEIPEHMIHIPKWKNSILGAMTGKPFLLFSLGFCVIPYTIQEFILLIISLTNPTQAIDTVGSLREWVTKNYVKYILMMFTLAGFINWFIIRHFIK